MKRLITILTLAATCFASRAQTNVIFGYLSDITGTAQAGVPVVLSLISPQPKLINGIWVNVPTKTVKSVSGGLYSFNNLVGGQYEVDAQGGFLSFVVTDTTSGSNNVTSLMTNVYVLRTAYNLAPGTNAAFRTNGALVFLDMAATAITNSQTGVTLGGAFTETGGGNVLTNGQSEVILYDSAIYSPQLWANGVGIPKVVGAPNTSSALQFRSFTTGPASSATGQVTFVKSPRQFVFSDPIVADGSGITNIPAASITGQINAGQVTGTPTNLPAATVERIFAAFTNLVATNGAFDTSGGTAFIPTNNARVLLNKNPAKLFVFGDSLDMELRTNGWKAFGGFTNNSIASANTNQADGSVFYNSGTYAANNTCFLVTLTNLLAQSGYSMALDNAGCVPGQAMWSIFGGSLPNQNTYSAQDISGFPYNANGRTNYPSLIDSRLFCYWPGSTNDYGFVYNGVTNLVTYGTNSGLFGGVARGSGGFSTAVVTFLGTPLSNNTARVTVELYAGEQFAYAAPYLSTSLQTNNTWGVLTWGYSNAPVRTGVAAAAFLMAGGNDLVRIANASYTFFPTYITNQVAFIWSNNVAACAQLKAWGYSPVILGVYPMNYNFQSFTNPPAGNQWQTYAIQRLQAFQRAAPASAVDIIFDAAATNIQFINNYFGYMDGTHLFGTNTLKFGTNTYAAIGNYFSQNYSSVFAGTNDGRVVTFANPLNTFGGDGNAITRLNALSIVATNSPSSGNALRYNGTNFYWGN